MQIGCCWFDTSQTTLTNHENDTSWKMPVVEFNVVTLLTQHRGQVLSIQQLMQQLPENAQTKEALTAAIERIRFFLGSSSELLVAVDDQGFMLLKRINKAKVNLNGLGPHRTISNKQYGILMAQLMLLLIFIYSIFEPTPTIQQVEGYQVATPSGQVEYYPIMINAGEHAINASVNKFDLMMAQCKRVLWQEVYVSRSTSDKLMSIVLTRDINGQREVKNVKAYSDEKSFAFIDTQWLVRQGICS
ncbi:helix-turn-helix domain-containing protein [Shewanella sp. Scap07]|uniref:winged helix-turn-helix domain-containing protein n=1 Tax=Shewanella sp. Scap07 TaxID=2589987 RepID=UPI0015B81826|nr:winged helix-turn-helix domain-containing protein [Shewanella sp. Scap07]QLE84345.1 helix-turn-helix domain-containing protein [Shewanella sp. Scap07]